MSEVEYEFPEEVLGTIASCRQSKQVLQKRIEDHEKMDALIKEKIATCKAHQSHDDATIAHTVRTYLASEGVPLNDLGNWIINESNACRKVEDKDNGEG